jgi:steroid 5-alpha reductase family enzyme
MISHWFLSIALAQFVMLLAWMLYRYIGNPIVADIFWGLSITILGWFHVFYQAPLHTYSEVLLIMLTMWGLRLSGYLYFSRLRHHWHDKRYQTLQERSHNLFVNYQIQGGLQTIIAVPWFFIGHSSNLLSCLLGGLVFAIGFCIECIADLQLKQFKATHQHKLCRKGLWKYSRHPNYFGEILIWIGFSIAALSSIYAVIGMISPICLFLVMRFITGPLTEETSLRSRGKSYLNYQQKTPMIFPNLKQVRRDLFSSK